MIFIIFLFLLLLLLLLLFNVMVRINLSKRNGNFSDFSNSPLTGSQARLPDFNFIA